jgi:hypothetical protein
VSTTVDDAPHGGQGTGAAPVLDPPSAPSGSAEAASPSAPPHPWWRPLASWKARGHRILPGLWFPLVVFAVWRVASLVVTLRLGGDVETAYNYDGEHYLRILHYGYWNPRPMMPAHAFFPGVSWLATPLFRLTGSDALTVHTVATVTGLGAFAGVWGAATVWRSEAVARRAVVLFAVFPSTLFLWAFYSEGLFIALGAGAVWADRRGRHGIATACLLGVATTRSIGVLVPLVLVLARVIRQRRVDRWSVAYAAAGVVGLVAVLMVMGVQIGDPFAWLTVQDDWGREVAPPWASVIQGFENLHPEPRTVMVPALVARNLDLWCVPIVLAPILYAALSRRDRFPMETWMLGVAMIALPLSSSVLASFNRFVMATWVIYPVYGSIAGRLPRWVRWPAGLVVAGLGIWVGYRMIGRFTANRFVG